MAKIEYSALQAAVWRFIRVVVPQLPALVNTLLNIAPQYTAELVLAGAFLTALDKYLRDKKLY